MTGIVHVARGAAQWLVSRAGIRSERGSIAVEHALVVAALSIVTVGALALLAALQASGSCQESWDQITPNC